MPRADTAGFGMGAVAKLLGVIAFCCVLAAPAAAVPAKVLDIGSSELQELIKKESRKRAVLVNFWATWCGPCRMEIPHLIEADAAYEDDELLILGVSIDVQSRPVQLYAQKMGITYPVFKANMDVNRAFQINAVPRTLLFTEKGMIMDMKGYLSKSKLDKVLQMVTKQ